MTPTKMTFYLVIIIGFFLVTSHGRNLELLESRPQKEVSRQYVKTINTRYGDIYDCVDFFEQPTFKHPKLKDHDFYPEMRPNFIPNLSIGITRNNVKKSSPYYVLENGGCPRGTVPIKRLSKQDRIRAAIFSNTHVYNSTNQQFSPPGTHFAILQTRSSSSPPKYFGVGAQMSIWNPQVKENQYSAGQVMIQNGLDSLQVGWMVNPTMYKDNETHLFIHTNAGESHCYNTYCPGFVLVRSDIPLDVTLAPYSTPGKLPRVNSFFIYQDIKSGNWWLLVSEDSIPIGFWPEKIFSSLNKFGTYISCGGETFSSPDQPSGYPPMGSGVYPTDIQERDAFAIHFETADEKLQIIDVQDTEKFMDTKKYIVDDVGTSKATGHSLFFGGYGG